MLERIEEIKGVGLLHDVNGKPYKLQKATIFYADNGRGKSTLATILRSLREGDATPVVERKTIAGTHDPKVTLQFADGYKVSLSAGKWSEARPEFIVFDSDFVEKNVYSGAEVNTGHRKNLLEFVLGAKAVSARANEKKATNNADKSSKEVKDIEDMLRGYTQGVRLHEFEGLQKVDDPEKKIEELDKRISTAKKIEWHRKRDVPRTIDIPQIDIKQWFDVLGKTIENVQADAEDRFRKHIETLKCKSAEAWLSQGQEFDDGKTCPYCAQSTDGIDLIKAYRSHFDKSYSDLKSKVQQLDKKVDEACSQTLVKDFYQKLETAKSAATAWGDEMKLEVIDFDDTTALGKLSELKSLLSGLVKTKQLSPTISVGNKDDEDKAIAIWKEIAAMMEAANAQISKAKTVIEEFKEKLDSDDIPKLSEKKKQIELSKTRHSDDVAELFKSLEEARARSKVAEDTKKNARKRLHAEMKQTLSQYEQSINELLDKFGAIFKIEKMDTNFRGGTPRSEYGLALRGRSVPLEGGTPSFGTALSEGDKRTLALAFFVASTLADPNLGSKIVVVDDPMCSLDLNRRHETRTVLKKICQKSKQLIVFAHDKYFVRDLEKHLRPTKDSSDSVAVYSLSHAGSDYTKIDNIDINRECQSDYCYNYHLLFDYVKGKGKEGDRQVAGAIRPFLEGYLHRRFPSLISEGLMFGQIINYIDKKAPPGSPVLHAKCLVEELQQINDYAGKFHHDTNPKEADTVNITPTELNKFSQRALDIVHKGCRLNSCPT